MAGTSGRRSGRTALKTSSAPPHTKVEQNKFVNYAASDEYDNDDDNNDDDGAENVPK